MRGPSPVPPVAGAWPSGRSHVPALDGLRGLSVLAVVGFHVWRPVPGQWLSSGQRAVDVFFALSGFLITLVLVDERARTGTIRLGRFWTHRVRRLVPAGIVLLAGCGLFLGFVPSPGESLGLRASTVALLTTGGLRWARPPSVYLLHLWSLTVEIYFYLLWPLLLAGLLRVGAPRAVIGGAALGGFALSYGLRTFLLHAFVHSGGLTGPWAVAYPSIGHLYDAPETHCDGLWLGAFGGLAVAWGWGKGCGRLAVPAAAGLAALVAVFPDGPWTFPVAIPLAALLATLVLAAVIREQSPRLARALAWPPLTWAGRVSYGVFLWNWPLVVALSTRHDALLRNGTVLGLTGWPAHAAAVGASLAAGALSHRFVEQPFLARRGLRPPDPARPGTPAGSGTGGVRPARNGAPPIVAPAGDPLARLAPWWGSRSPGRRA